jgi:hypothetical protein
VPGLDETAGLSHLSSQYESAARVGLNRVHACYALTIRFDLAHFGDIWRADERHPKAPPLPAKLERFGPFIDLYPVEKAVDSARIDLEVRLALEMLHSRTPQPGKLIDSRPGVDGHSERVKWSVWRTATAVAAYLTSPVLREQALERVAARVYAGDEEVVLLAHGLGSVIAYDLLLSRPDLPVRCLVTLGSPLGLEGVRSALWEMDGQNAVALNRAGDLDGARGPMIFPHELPRWINLYNSLDRVASGQLLKEVYIPQSPADSRHVEDIDTGKLQRPALTGLFAEHHPATYLSSKVAGLVLRSVVEE